jgi:hypothetical protein
MKNLFYYYVTPQSGYYIKNYKNITKDAYKYYINIWKSKNDPSSSDFVIVSSDFLDENGNKE